MAAPRKPRRNPMLVSSGSKTVIFSDSVSRDASEGNSDAHPEGMIWQNVRIHGTSLRGETITSEEAGQDRHVLGVIGRWYAECEYDDKRQTPPVNALGGIIPWGAVLPIRLEGGDLEKLGEKPVGHWLSVLRPGMQHTFSTFLFYRVREAREDDRQDYATDRAENPNSENLGELYHIAVLYFPVEREMITSYDDAIIEVLSHERMSQYINRRYSLFPRSVPRSAFHVMKPGEVVLRFPHYDADALQEFDADDQLVSRFLDSYVRAVNDLSVGDSCDKEIVARDYWLARRELHPEVFAAVDARHRLLLYICYLRACSRGDEVGALRIENGLVRVMRCIYELGWPNEHNMIEYVYWCGADTGRVSSDMLEITPPSVPSQSKKGGTDLKRKARLITCTHTSRPALQRVYADLTSKNALPTLGASAVPMVPLDLECLSRRAGALDSDWVMRSDATYVGLLAETDVMRAGDSFVIAEGYPTRFYHESDPSVDDRYTQLAFELFQLQKPGASSDEFRAATLALRDGRSVIIYPALIFESLAALRAELGPDLWQPCHRPAGLFAHVGPIERDQSARDWHLTSIQPSVGSAVEGLKQTLWPSSIATREGEPLPVVPSELFAAIQKCKNIYQRGHPSGPSAALVAPTVFWLRPLEDILTGNPSQDAMKMLEKLPTVDIDSTSGRRALVIAYRDWPFVFSESVRWQMQDMRARLHKEYRGNLNSFVRNILGSRNPADLLALIDRINMVLLKGAECNGLCLNLDRITNMHEREAPHQAPETSIEEPPPPQPSGAPNGLNSTDDLTVARNRALAAEANGQRDVDRRLRTLQQVFSMCDTVPERTRDAVWERDAADPKKSISVEATEKNPKYPASFRWYDFKVGTGFVGSMGLSAYAYALREAGSVDDVRSVMEERKKQKHGATRLVFSLLKILPADKQAGYWEFLQRTLVPLYNALTQQPRPEPEGVPPPKRPRPAKNDKSLATQTEAVLKLWRTSVHVSGPGLVYLRETRQLWNLPEHILEHSPFLKYASHLVYNRAGEELSDSKIKQGLVCFLTDPAGGVEPTSVQRIFLSPDGKKFVPKSGDGKVKLTLGPSTGRAWCAQPGRAEILGAVFLAEGPEKALAVASCSRYAPSFACMGVSNMRNFAHLRDMVPQPTLVIVGDADHTVSLQQDEIRQLRAAGWKNVKHWIPWCANEACRCKDANDVMVNHTILGLIGQLHPHLPLSYMRQRMPAHHHEPPHVEWSRYRCLQTK